MYPVPFVSCVEPLPDTANVADGVDTPSGADIPPHPSLLPQGRRSAHLCRYLCHQVREQVAERGGKTSAFKGYLIKTADLPVFSVWIRCAIPG
jgi:hypothetical protein